MAQSKSAGRGVATASRPLSSAHQSDADIIPAGTTPQFPILVARLPKNADEEVRVTIDKFKNHLLLDVRIFADFTAANTPFPTKRGVSIRIGQLPDLLDALQDAAAAARKLGLLDEAD